MTDHRLIVSPNDVGGQDGSYPALEGATAIRPTGPRRFLSGDLREAQNEARYFPRNAGFFLAYTVWEPTHKQPSGFDRKLLPGCAPAAQSLAYLVVVQ